MTRGRFVSSARDFISSFERFARSSAHDTELDAACRSTATNLGADGVGVSLALPTTLRTLIGSSNQTSRLLEQAELTTGEGPCTQATLTGLPVHAADLTDPRDDRWPGLVRTLERVPVRAVVALPLLVDGRPLGSVNVHSARPHGLDGLRRADLDVAAATMTRAALRARPPEPDHATTIWRQISVAAGMVMARRVLTPEDALALMRAHAFRHDRWLSDLAYDVLSGRHPVELDHGGPGPDGP